MIRRLITLSLIASLALATAAAPAQAAERFEGVFARLNKPIVPGTPMMPGLPTASPLGLLLPRGSNLVSMAQKGGMSTKAGRLDAVGVLSPRVSPVVAMAQGVPKTRSERMLYGLTVLSPRAAVLVVMLQAVRKLPETMQGSVASFAPGG